VRVRNRIIGFKNISASMLVDNSKNWRIHPENQKSAMRKILNSIGFAGAVLVRGLEDGRYEIIDGHLRKDLMQNSEVPIIIADLNDDEADVILATFDPIASMAVSDKQKLDSLVRGLDAEISDAVFSEGKVLEIPDIDGMNISSERESINIVCDSCDFENVKDEIREVAKKYASCKVYC